MIRTALTALAVFALSGCGLQGVQPETAPSTNTPIATKLAPGSEGPLIFPTHLTFSSPTAPPRIVLAAPGLGFLIGMACEETGTETVITISGRIGPHHVGVFKVTPHAKGSCSVNFFKESSSETAALSVTVD